MCRAAQARLCAAGKRNVGRSSFRDCGPRRFRRAWSVSGAEEGCIACRAMRWCCVPVPDTSAARPGRQMPEVSDEGGYRRVWSVSGAEEGCGACRAMRWRCVPVPDTSAARSRRQPPLQAHGRQCPAGKHRDIGRLARARNSPRLRAQGRAPGLRATEQHRPTCAMATPGWRARNSPAHGRGGGSNNRLRGEEQERRTEGSGH